MRAVAVPVAQLDRRAARHRRRTARTGSGRPGAAATRTPVAGGGAAHEAAELEQAAGGRQALDLHGRGGQVQGGQLVGGEAGIAERVLLRRDAVAVDRREPPGDRLDPQRDAHAAQLVLVALEGPPERRLLLGVVELAPDLLGRDRQAGGEQERGEVEEALELGGRHAVSVPYAVAAASVPARWPAAAAARKKSGSASGPRPMVVTATPAASSSAATSGGSTTSHRWRSTPSRPRRSGTGTRTADRTRSRAVRVWWLRPWWRGRGSPEDMRRATMGWPAERGRGVEDRRPPRPRWCRAAMPVPTTPGPMPTMTTSASLHVAGQRQRPRHATRPRGRRRRRGRR